MANPVVVACPEGAWTKVASGVTSGLIHVLKTDATYVQTYRVASDPAPTDLTDAVEFQGSLEIAAAAAIDVYVWCKTNAGSVRVDL